MQGKIPVPFGLDKLGTKTLLPGIFGYKKPKKQKMDKSISSNEYAEMYYQLRMSLIDKGASEEEIEIALKDLESRVTIFDTPSGNRSTQDTINQRHKQLQATGD